MQSVQSQLVVRLYRIRLSQNGKNLIFLNYLVVVSRNEHVQCRYWNEIKGKEKNCFILIKMKMCWNVSSLDIKNIDTIHLFAFISLLFKIHPLRHRKVYSISIAFGLTVNYILDVPWIFHSHPKRYGLS